MATLWLVGMMGSGKTTVGPLVAGRCELDFVDLDAEIERTRHKAIGELFASGEFREAESAALRSVAGSGAVVACGGGVVLDGGNRRLMRDSGCVIWLQVSPAVLADRIGSGAGRPLLGDDPAADLVRIDAERVAAYEKSAHLRVDATGDPEDVAARVVESWTTWS